MEGKAVITLLVIGFADVWEQVAAILLACFVVAALVTEAVVRVVGG